MSVKKLPPETKVKLNGYKLPLTEINGGHGYYGTIAYDQSLTYTQCYICGYFYRGVAAHVRRSHQVLVSDYKARYGLAQRTSLAAPITKEGYRKSQDGKQREKNLKLAKSKQTHLSRVKAGKTYHSLIERNKKGTCPDQTIDKIVKLKEKLKHTPTRSEFIKEYGHGPVKTLRTLFGGWGEAVKQAGLK